VKLCVSGWRRMKRCGKQEKTLKDRERKGEGGEKRRKCYRGM